VYPSSVEYVKVRSEARRSTGPIPVVGGFPCAVEAREGVQVRVMLSRKKSACRGAGAKKYRPKAIRVAKEGKW
jgi:hypothetical protein